MKLFLKFFKYPRKKNVLKKYALWDKKKYLNFCIYIKKRRDENFLKNKSFFVLLFFVKKRNNKSGKTKIWIMNY